MRGEPIRGIWTRNRPRGLMRYKRKELEVKRRITKKSDIRSKLFQIIKRGKGGVMMRRKVLSRSGVRGGIRIIIRIVLNCGFIIMIRSRGRWIPLKRS